MPLRPGRVPPGALRAPSGPGLQIGRLRAGLSGPRIRQALPVPQLLAARLRCRLASPVAGGAPSLALPPRGADDACCQAWQEVRLGLQKPRIRRSGRSCNPAPDGDPTCRRFLPARDTCGLMGVVAELVGFRDSRRGSGGSRAWHGEAGTCPAPHGQLEILQRAIDAPLVRAQWRTRLGGAARSWSGWTGTWPGARRRQAIPGVRRSFRNGEDQQTVRGSSGRSAPAANPPAQDLRAERAEPCPTSAIQFCRKRCIGPPETRLDAWEFGLKSCVTRAPCAGRHSVAPACPARNAEQDAASMSRTVWGFRVMRSKGG